MKSTGNPYDRLWEEKLQDASWLARDGEGRVAHAVELLRRRGLSASARILDVGCGRGTAGIRLDRRRGLFGVDISFRAGGEAAKAYQGVVSADAGTDGLPFRDDTFELCLMLDVVEHLPDPPSILSETRRVLREGGHLLICTPNILYWRHLRTMVAGRRFPKTSTDSHPYGGGHVHFFTYRDLEALLRSAPFDTAAPSGPLAGAVFQEFREPLVWLIARK